MSLILMGFHFSGKKWFGKPGMDLLAKFTVEITLPFYMFYNIYKDIGSRKALASLIFKLPEIGRASCRERVCQYV